MAAQNQALLYKLSGASCPEHFRKFASKNPIVKDLSILATSESTARLQHYNFYSCNNIDIQKFFQLLSQNLDDKSKSVAFQVKSGIQFSCDYIAFNSVHNDHLYLDITASSYKLIPFIKKEKAVSFKKVAPLKNSTQLAEVYKCTIPISSIANKNIAMMMSTVFPTDKNNVKISTHEFPEVDSALEQEFGLKSWSPKVEVQSLNSGLNGCFPTLIPNPDNSSELYEYLVLLHLNSSQLLGSLNSAISSYDPPFQILNGQEKLRGAPIVQTMTLIINSSFIVETIDALLPGGDKSLLSFSLKTYSEQHILAYMLGSDIYVWEIK